MSASFSELDANQVVELPIDQLSMAVLRHLDETDAWNTGNFFIEQHRQFRHDGAERALIEAVSWLLANGLIARGHPSQGSSDAMIITRLGRQVLADGPDTLDAQKRLGIDLHRRLARVRSQFLLGEYELAAFAAMREVEIRVRELSKLDAALIGVALMRQAFNPKTGPLADPDLDEGEKVGTMELFAGSIGTFKNPPSHRQVNYADPTEASEVVLLADLLMRILDRTAARLKRASRRSG